MPSYLDRARANSFGSVADLYESSRPRYPDALITDLVTRPGLRVLDVGAGTGIASIQLAAAGADVLAVEPDSHMAAVARGKGIVVEEAFFEDWEARNRHFDLVVFAQSFHWVEPHVALEKIARILEPAGRLALIWNRIATIDPPEEVFTEIHSRVRAESPSSAEQQAVRASKSADNARAVIEGSGFHVERFEYPTELHYSADEYLDMVFTYSRQVILDPATQDTLRARLAEPIGPGGVVARNTAIAIICTPG